MCKDMVNGHVNSVYFPREIVALLTFRAFVAVVSPAEHIRCAKIWSTEQV